MIFKFYTEDKACVVNIRADGEKAITIVEAIFNWNTAELSDLVSPHAGSYLGKDKEILFFSNT